MSVRQSLLAILDQGPCYGYQLRAEFERRTGATWPLNVGQIYNTLDRLERDRLVEKGETDDRGHVYWRITDAGSTEVAAWFGSPVERGQGTRDPLTIKLALAATLPGVDVGALIRTQREASLARLDLLREARSARATTDDGEGVAEALVAETTILAAEADLRVLERSEEILADHPPRSRVLALSIERPKRGRPARRADGAQGTPRS